MERIELLLEKYFQGTTTLQEEKELKLYFSSENVQEEYKKFLPLFDFITYQKKITCPSFTLSKQTSNRPLWIKLSAISGVAACIAFAMILILTPSKRATDTFIVMNGNRLNNKQLAQQYVEDKLSKVSAVFDKSLQPIEIAKNNIQESLNPLTQAGNKLELVSNYESKLLELSKIQ